MRTLPRRFTASREVLTLGAIFRQIEADQDFGDVPF